MAEGTIAIGATTLDTPTGYTPHAPKPETLKLTLNNNLIVNYPVTAEGQPIDKYIFEITDVVNSKLRELETEFRHIGNLDYIDYIQIQEVLSGDGTTKTFYTQRRMNSITDPLPTITVGGVTKSPTLTADDSGRGKMVFTDAPADVDNNIVILYEPKFYVHFVDYYRTGMIKDVATYTLICREAQA
jgi:hypothetical protein